jgi:1-aminocyclopropane-1-carboxylate deaminase/D-cysteine desulfhydrase-like pyridoxal-dependent ACC family enzyme
MMTTGYDCTDLLNLGLFRPIFSPTDFIQIKGRGARKLDFLCGDAVATGARSLVTVGAAQSNHCRMTAAAGARLGLETHLVLSGDRPDEATGNQLLSMLFGAQLHFTGAEESHWGELEIAREGVSDQLVAEGLAPYAIPIGGSTAVGALGYAAAFIELLDQCEAAGLMPSHVVFTSSSGGTHAGLLAGRAAAAHGGRDVPDVVAIGVAKGVNIGRPDIAGLANQTLTLMQSTAIVAPEDVEVDTRWIGDGLAALETLVATHGRGFCHGDAPTMADCLLLPQLYAARRWGVAVDGYPHLLAVEAHAMAVPAIAASHPERHPDAE